MVEVRRKRSKLLRLARSLNPRQPRRNEYHCSKSSAEILSVPRQPPPPFHTIQTHQVDSTDNDGTTVTLKTSCKTQPKPLQSYHSPKHELMTVSLQTSGPSRPQGTSPFTFHTIEAEVLPDSICPLCLNLGEEVWDPDYRERHELGEPSKHLRPAEDVYRAAKQGCSGCRIVAWVLEPYMERLEEQGGKVRLSFDKLYFPKSGGLAFYYLEFYGCVLPMEKAFADIGIRSIPYTPIQDAHPCSANSPCPWKNLKPIAVMSEDTGSSAAIKKVHTWYSECLSRHEQCLQSSSSQLPTRIIRINGPHEARLYTPEAENADYVCLSHCWGGQAVIQTTTRNLERYTAGLPWEDLPRTFQHAIEFTHGLGFDYLWIDSLCIIQDSVDDWRHEGSHMSEIYANASMTLSATWATDPRQGCFVKLDKQYTPRERRFTYGDHKTYDLHCHELLPALQTPLQKRGWVFQERMLSKRIVHFMEQELWWECRDSFTCECGNHSNKSLGIGMHWKTRISEPFSLKRMQENWEYMVQIYTMKSLTYPSDIFPALQGLAKLFPSSMGRYLAGNWENTLVRSLCWFPRQPGSYRPAEWRAPSWSWASAQGAVRWPASIGGHDDTITTHVTALSAVTIPKGDDPMGQLSYGAIVLRGKPLAGRLQRVDDRLSSTHRVWLEGSEHNFKLEEDTSTIVLDVNGSISCGSKVPILALRVLDMKDSDGNESYGTQFWLILRPAEVAANGFVRIGTIFATLVMEGESFMRKLNALYDRNAVETDITII